MQYIQELQPRHLQVSSPRFKVLFAGDLVSVTVGQLIAEHPLYARHVPNGIALNARPIAVVINSYQLPAGLHCIAHYPLPPHLTSNPTPTHPPTITRPLS